MNDQLSNSLRDSFNEMTPLDPNIPRNLDLEEELKRVFSDAIVDEIHKELANVLRTTSDT